MTLGNGVGPGGRDSCGSHLAVSVWGRCRCAHLTEFSPIRSSPDSRLPLGWRRSVKSGAITGDPSRHLGSLQIVELQKEQLRACLTKENCDLHTVRCPVGKF